MQYNIFHNDFYEELPGLSWAYRLDVLLGESPEPILRLGKAVKEVDLPEAELKVQQAFFYGLVFRIPIRYKNSGTFSITFNDNKRLDVYRDLMRLFRRSYDNREQNNVAVSEEFREMYQTIGSDYRQRKYSDLRQELSFVIYELDPRKINYRDTQLVSEMHGEELRIVGLETNDPEIVAKYTIRDCYIENIEEITFDYSSEECVEWSLKVHFNSFKVDYHNQDKIYMPEHEPDGFEMENLDMTGYLPDSESRYIAKFDPKRENDVDPGGKAAMTRSQLLARAKKVLEETGKALEDKARNDRESAVKEWEKHVDETGRDEHGNVGTYEHKEHADTDLSDQMAFGALEAHSFTEMYENGVDLLQTSGTVAEQAANAQLRSYLDPIPQGPAVFPVSEEDSINASKAKDPTKILDMDKMDPTIIPAAVNLSQSLQKELAAIPEKVNFANQDIDVVENAKTEEGLSYYGEDRNTLEKNTATQGVAGAIAKNTHGEYQAALEEALYYGRKMREEINLKDNGYKDYDTWLSNVNTYSKLRDEALDRVIKAGGNVEQIAKDHPEFAKSLEKYK